MSDINITVDGGTSKRLLTAGKLCDRNILVTATGGGGDLPEEAFYWTGERMWNCCNNTWNWFIENYGHRVITENITSASYMFQGSNNLTKVPFVINLACSDGYMNADGMFKLCSSLAECPRVRAHINWTTSIDFGTMLHNCESLRDAEDLFTPEMTEGIKTILVGSEWSAPKLPNFYQCRSLRKVPTWFLNYKMSEDSVSYPYVSYCYAYYNAFTGCSALDEITNLPVWNFSATQTNNMFYEIVSQCYRLKNFTFETHEDGTPYTARWNNQFIDLSQNIGHCPEWSDGYEITAYNSGITDEARIRTHEELIFTEFVDDWWTTDKLLSRYGIDSARATINSLPDTSVAGGGNTIKFDREQGLLSYGNDIYSLTEEEIAVAAAKGWTVSFA